MNVPHFQLNVFLLLLSQGSEETPVLPLMRVTITTDNDSPINVTVVDEDGDETTIEVSFRSNTHRICN